MIAEAEVPQPSRKQKFGRVAGREECPTFTRAQHCDGWHVPRGPSERLLNATGGAADIFLVSRSAFRGNSRAATGTITSPPSYAPLLIGRVTTRTDSSPTWAAPPGFSARSCCSPTLMLGLLPLVPASQVARRPAASACLPQAVAAGLRVCSGYRIRVVARRGGLADRSRADASQPVVRTTRYACIEGGVGFSHVPAQRARRSVRKNRPRKPGQADQM